MIYRPFSADIMIYDSRLKNSKVRMDAMKDKKKNDTNDPSKFSSNLPIEEDIEGLNVFLGDNIGSINCPMSWVTRDNMLA